MSTDMPDEMAPEEQPEELQQDAVEDAPAMSRPVAQKEYYSISEVCDLTALKPHVLRYWETQFPVLNPSKNRSGNRVYQRKEIKLILYVKTLLYEEKYTVEGAKQKLEQLRKGGELQTETKKALDRQMVALLRAEMQQLTELLTPTKPIPTR
jgi:DNA-binding transcriptional MerR regulator